MAKVRTVLGEIPAEELGITAVHEHVFWDYDPKWQEKSIDFSRQALEQFQAAGGETVIDVAPHPYRIPEWYQALAPQVNVHIVLSTGFYLERRTPLKFHNYSESQMVERFLFELNEDIQASSTIKCGLKAGVIKAAGERSTLSPWEQKVFRAAARAQRETGVPICTHAMEGAWSQFELLTNSGADPERIYISHTETEIGWEGRSLTEQVEYLCRITQAGGSLYFSNFGWEFLSQEENFKNLMLSMCERGYRSRLLFSSDANYKVDEAGNTWWEEQKNHPELPLKNFAYTFHYTVPLLKRWGFSDEDIHSFLVENPKAMFSAAKF